LKNHTWAPINKKLHVLCHTHDLGTHLSLNAAIVGTTINERIDETISTVERIAKMPFTTKIKATHIRMAAFPKPVLNEFTARARQRTVQTNRTAMRTVEEVDHFLLRKSMRKFAGEEEAILESVVTLATADDVRKFELDYAKTQASTLCGHAE